MSLTAHPEARLVDCPNRECRDCCRLQDESDSCRRRASHQASNDEEELRNADKDRQSPRRGGTFRWSERPHQSKHKDEPRKGSHEHEASAAQFSINAWFHIMSSCLGVRLTDRA